MAIQKRRFGDGRESFVVDSQVRGRRVRRLFRSLADAMAFDVHIHNRMEVASNREPPA